ncbi:MAG: heme-binding domain-containing protein [Ignavibacteriae bacterium]|nr:heme-binding domain-containing protein [Ignavibacteriota bacterium]
MKKTILIILGIFVVIQFIRIDKSVPDINYTNDIFRISNPTTEIKTMLKNACYDCHSYETKYPWYAEIAPVSWLLKNHIDEGRRHLNFSTWNEYDNEKKLHKLDECIEMVKSGEMPMQGYVMMHSEAELTDDQKNYLANWFSAQKDSL